MGYYSQPGIFVFCVLKIYSVGIMGVLLSFHVDQASFFVPYLARKSLPFQG